MLKVLFVCHGNICRSPMAEFIFKKLVKDQGIEQDFFIASRATSTEEIGNPIYYLAEEKLKEHGIVSEGKYAQKLDPKDYDNYDYIIGMDSENLYMMKKIFGKTEKISKLLDFTDNKKDIEDPWYTRDFETTYQEITKGCLGLLEAINRK